MYTGTRWRSLAIFKIVHRLKGETDQTEEEKLAINAFNRIIGGILGLCILMIIAVSLVFVFTLDRTPLGIYGDTRYGTIQEDGRVRYVKNTNQYKTKEELGLSEYELAPGDRIVLIFDTDTDVIKAAYPQKIWDEFEKRAALSVSAVLVVSILVFIFYGLVICRATWWGRALWQFVKTQPEWQKELEEEREWKETPLWKRLIVNCVVIAVACVILWPWFVEIVENVKRLQNIEEMSNTYQEGMKAGQEAERISDALQNIGSDGGEDAADGEDLEEDEEAGDETKKSEDGKSDGVDRAEDAAGNIYDILSGME